MLGSDLFRAVGILAATAAGAAALAGFAPELRAAGVLPAPAERQVLVYTVIEMTEHFDARRACPLDLGSARAKIEGQIDRLGFQPVYSPIADGPGVLTHEFLAEHPASAGGCTWQVAALLNGRATPASRDHAGEPLSALDRLAPDLSRLLAERPAAPAS
ncbi:MAG: hypothetical protein VX529_08650 [Pseudomonadota bacterium]|nr:hypothetical protein [Pseudomonadota bacterium]